jgi:hypothetical protein
MNPIKIKSLIKNSDDGINDIYFENVGHPHNIKISILKIKSDSTVEIDKYTDHAIIRVEKGSLIIGRDYKDEDAHDRRYEYLKKGQLFVIKGAHYYNLSCDEGERATVTIINLQRDDEQI